MGVTYHGKVPKYRSLNENLPATEACFPITGQHFGHRNKRKGNVTVIESENPLKTAKEFYDKIAFGGFDEAKGEGKIRTTLRDKTVIFFRVSSRSGGPAVDINIKASKEPTKIVSQKIHFILGGSK